MHLPLWKAASSDEHLSTVVGSFLISHLHILHVNETWRPCRILDQESEPSLHLLRIPHCSALQVGRLFQCIAVLSKSAFALFEALVC